MVHFIVLFSYIYFYSTQLNSTQLPLPFSTSDFKNKILKISFGLYRKNQITFQDSPNDDDSKTKKLHTKNRIPTHQTITVSSSLPTSHINTTTTPLSVINLRGYDPIADAG